jgi:hypothetical protein
VTSTEASRPEPAPAGRTAEADPTTAIPAALRDAGDVSARVSADEAAADAERARLASQPLPSLGDGIEPSMRLHPKELLHAIRPAAMLDDGHTKTPAGGTLYLTSRRLVHTGSSVREVDLADIADAGVALERLLLLDLADGSDLAIEVDQPRLLRVQLAAARAAARERPRQEREA